MGITKEKIELLHTQIAGAKKIVITAHKSPDGDSIGSSLGLYHYLKQINPNVVICHPDKAPYFLHWMPGFDQIISLEESGQLVEDSFKSADLIFCLDYNSSSRIGTMEKPLVASNAFKVMIDHHREPDENFCDLMFSDITSCSTAQLIYEIIAESNHLDKIIKESAQCLYTGIVTDTGSFRFSSTLPKTHRIAADLLSRNINHSEIHENTYDTNSLDRIKLVSFALLEKLVVLGQYQTAYISLTAKEQERFNATKGDTEGLVNQALAIQGVRMAVFMKESDGIVKMSFRSKGKIPVSEMAKNNFSGGGHLNAAGGKFVGNMENAIQKFVTILPKFVEENKSLF